MNIFKKATAYLAWKSKVSEARQRFKITGKRYFVVPIKGELVVANVEELFTLKNQHILPEDFSKSTVYGMAYFWTDTKNPSAKSKGEMPTFERKRRRQYYYRWFEYHHR